MCNVPGTLQNPNTASGAQAACCFEYQRTPPPAQSPREQHKSTTASGAQAACRLNAPRRGAMYLALAAKIGGGAAWPLGPNTPLLKDRADAAEGHCVGCLATCAGETLLFGFDCICCVPEIAT